MPLLTQTVRLSALIGALPLFISGVAMCTLMYYKVEAMEKRQERFEKEKQDVIQLVIDVRERVIRIEAQTKNKE